MENTVTKGTALEGLMNMQMRDLRPLFYFIIFRLLVVQLTLNQYRFIVTESESNNNHPDQLRQFPNHERLKKSTHSLSRYQ